MFTPANGTFSQLIKKINTQAKHGKVTPRHSLIIPLIPRLNRFTRYPPKKVPPPPQGTAT